MSDAGVCVGKVVVLVSEIGGCKWRSNGLMDEVDMMFGPEPRKGRTFLAGLRSTTQTLATDSRTTPWGLVPMPAAKAKGSEFSVGRYHPKCPVDLAQFARNWGLKMKRS